MAKKNPNIETYYPAPGSLVTQEDKIAHEKWLAAHPRPRTGPAAPTVGKPTEASRKQAAKYKK